MIEHGEKSAAWALYDACVRDGRSGESENEHTLHHGQLTSSMAETLRQIVTEAEVDTYRNGDGTPGFFSVEYDAATLQTVNRGSTFRAFNAYEAWHIADVLDSLRDEVAGCLGSPWKVLHLKAWSTTPRADPEFMYGWHTDDFVPEMFKIMIYLVPLSVETGSIEFMIDEKEVSHTTDAAGAWVLFSNSTIKHRGVPGTKTERPVVEVTLARSAAFDTRPRFPGQWAAWPDYPWIGALDGCTGEEAKKIVEQRDMEWRAEHERSGQLKDRVATIGLLRQFTLASWLAEAYAKWRR